MKDILICVLFVFTGCMALLNLSLQQRVDLKEEWLTKVFNEGVNHGVCVTVKALESAEAVDRCFDVKNDNND